MQTLLIAVGAGVLFVVAYHTYGRWLGSRVFRLATGNPTPAVRFEDGSDFVPTPRSVLFGHHFTSIAGTGPIVGPAIAVMWGWLPALLWVVFGSILIGAVHDFGSLVVSLRHRGRSVGDIAGDVIHPRVRLLFLLVLFLALTIVIAIFGLVIAAVLRQYPAAIFPVMVQVPLAVGIGTWLHRRGVGLTLPSVLALGLMYATVLLGDWGPLHSFNLWMAGLSNMTWVILLLTYSYIASVLPVWVLLQPRDYINALQLVTALGLVVAGLFVAAMFGGASPTPSAVRPSLELVAPMVRWDPAGAPLLMPFLFITIACGAISGFHCMVSSGTSSKQLRCETDAKFVGFGSMLTEGFLAVIVILACCAGLGLGIAFGTGGGVALGEAAYLLRYESWQSSGGLAATVGAFVDGSGNLLKAMGIPGGAATALMAVLVASFAGTTLDTATRLQRYVVQELGGALAPDAVGRALIPDASLRLASASGAGPWVNKHVATLLAVGIAGALAAMPAPGQVWSWASAGGGGLILWPMFGATNQLLGGLAFLVIAFWLRRTGRPVWFLVVPLVFMLVMPAWAMVHQMFVAAVGRDESWLAAGDWLLMGIGGATLVLEGWIVYEAARLWPGTGGKEQGRRTKAEGGLGGLMGS
jgi:carbon starvation protein